MTNPLNTNPACFAYGITTGGTANPPTNLAAYGKPESWIITGRGNRNDPLFDAPRAAGAKKIAYLDMVEIVINPTPGPDADFYGFGLSDPANLWPGGTYQNYPGSLLANITPGSAWYNYCLKYVEAMFKSGTVDGLLSDVQSSRLWSPLWNTWTQAWRDKWSLSCAQLAADIDAIRRSVNPHLIYITNGIWDQNNGIALAAEKSVDGVMLEHHSPYSGDGSSTNPIGNYNTMYAGKTFGNLRKRVLIAARNTAEALIWKDIPGVTHVSDQASYMNPTPPPIPATRLDYQAVA